MKILVVDDDYDILQLVTIHLTREGYEVIQAQNGQIALKLLEETEVNLAIVDVMMPGMDGFSLTKILTKELEIPVILLTAKGQLADKEQGFKSGTEDYLVKPFEPKELLFRVAVVLRRYGRALESILKVGNVKINRNDFEVVINEETILFPLKEFELLTMLATRVNKVTPRTLLLDQAWGEDYEGNEQTLNTHMNRIRERLKRYGAAIEIQTIRGVGYKLEATE
ncbi:response regulator transcription factor [Paenibacillus urinalis]|uniref:Heme response regulator HssR n=1 Tax=Paenibacillus urinalis TaxID=521520 RepID=A0AAX3N1V8_9BACL|nr:MULTISPECIES: response regulator transcription factor [Paenibacillus]WDH83623.1 response regulator transcription factor [Paenibacillus urinalis]WDH99652.1 response regulator transcription factor [Paenibacillus urinalis]WDI03284.1 response regulator transcription factor [Paenibacillus urinalis]SDX35265.1 DNA-binding response regulator, OmpR family, contains REC and winged-helix (wHTH) domain [Paenibacillus sp. PDC88]GAK42388.1 DNA-binding response regulator [Paenibacillus sp. TCA20]